MACRGRQPKTQKELRCELRTTFVFPLSLSLNLLLNGDDKPRLNCHLFWSKTTSQPRDLGFISPALVIETRAVGMVQLHPPSKKKELRNYVLVSCFLFVL